MKRALYVTAFLLLSRLSAQAVQPDEILPDAALEMRARALSADLRCMVCQNQSIDDSDAPLARDLRILVRDRLKTGDSDEQVRKYLVSRYGDFILLKPPLKSETLLLWGTPALLAAFGGIFVFRRFRSRSAAQTSDLTAEEQAALDRLMPDRTIKN